jgi:hypothetical protein
MGADERALQRLLAKDEIVDLVHRYSYYADHRLTAKMLDLFTEDCVIDYGPAIAPPIRGLDAFRAMVGGGGGGVSLLGTSHHNANVLIKFETDDRASVRTSMYAWHKMSNGMTPRLWGYYHDVVVRVPAGWRFASRQLRILGSENWDEGWHSALDAAYWDPVG